jgi:peptidoglycan/xylan/chitin deacetylase (PgdA/CDA1 family)
MRPSLCVAAAVAILVLSIDDARAEGPAPAGGAATRPAAAPAALADPNQLPCLTDTPKQPRFKVTDRVWPAKPGEADLCLWADDKLAAFCFGVDDNWQSDHAWWLDQQKKYGFPCTWFVIVGRVGTGGFWGTWDDWKKLLAAGNDVQSHTVTHLDVTAPGYKGVEWDYAEAIKLLEQNLPGHKVSVLAYPGGTNSDHNSRELAAKYYLAARGTVGTLNAVDKIDYLNVNATRLHADANSKANWADIHQLLDAKSRQYYRGWGFYFTHNVERNQAVVVMDYLKAHEGDVWVGLFADQARYGQERDTAKLTVTAGAAQSVKFTLTDRMSDQRFDYPLTVKVRLGDGWKAASAKQAGKAVEAKVVEHEGGKFALVKAVPDRGEVEVVAAEK